MARLILAMVLLTLGGCASPYMPLRELHIDPAVGPGIVAATAEAADAWEYAGVPAIRIAISDRPGPVRGVLTWDDRKRTCKGRVIAYTSIRPHHEPRIYLCRRKLDGADPDVVYAVILHELGHAFARRAYHLEPGHVMSTRVDGSIVDLTDADAGYVQ